MDALFRRFSVVASPLLSFLSPFLCLMWMLPFFPLRRRYARIDDHG
jgi:hypothetical protein